MPDAGAQLARALVRALPADADHVTLREQASTVLRRYVGFDMAVWATVDPLTTMWTSCVIDGAPRDEALEAAVFANEYGVPDVLKITDLAHRPGAARGGTLAGVTGGDPTRSPRFRDVLAPRGVSDELRLVFSDGSTPWGALVLLRGGDRFTREEAAEVEAIGPPFAGLLRRSLLRDTAGLIGAEDAKGPSTGLVLCTPDGRIREVSAEAARLLAAVSPRETPAVIGSVVAKYRAGAGADAALAGADGRWLAFSVTALADTLAVVVERIRPARLAEIVVRSVGLTPRERDVLEHIVRGASTRHVARALRLSEWTVQDHLKRVFAKFGVTSRAELLSSLFFTHYAPLHGTGTPSPTGHFLADG